MESEKRMLGKYVMLGLVSLLLVISVVQAYQIESMKGEATVTGGVVAAPVEQQQGNTLPIPVQAPAMVGGC